MAKAFTFTRDDLLHEIADITGGRCLLAFSGGKDAVATWITLQESGRFPDIVAYHMALVPGLQFVEDGLAYYEDFFKAKIIRLPHVSFYRQMGSMTFQPPDRVDIIEAHAFDQLTKLEYLEVQEALAYDLGWNIPNTWTATGIRAADSLQRRIHITKEKARSPRKRQFYPCFDFLKADVMTLLDRHGVKLPVDYEMFGRSFDGLDYRFIKPIKERFPEDFKRIRFWYPLIDLELLRYEDGKAES